MLTVVLVVVFGPLVYLVIAWYRDRMHDLRHKTHLTHTIGQPTRRKR